MSISQGTRGRNFILRSWAIYQWRTQPSPPEKSTSPNSQPPGPDSRIPQSDQTDPQPPSSSSSTALANPSYNHVAPPPPFISQPQRPSVQPYAPPPQVSALPPSAPSSGWWLRRFRYPRLRISPRSLMLTFSLRTLGFSRRVWVPDPLPCQRRSLMFSRLIRLWGLMRICLMATYPCLKGSCLLLVGYYISLSTIVYIYAVYI